MMLVMATRQWVTFTLVMLTVTMVMPFIWHTQIQPSEEKDEVESNNNVVDEQLLRVIRSLDKASERRAEIEMHRRKHADKVIHSQMSAIVQNNSLPNYFLYKPEVDSAPTYHQAALVFVHHPRAAGSAVVSCLDHIARNKSLATSSVMDSDQRLLWATERLTERQTDSETSQANRDRFGMHRGRFAFGICSDLKRKCSHFTILREPMSRAVSSYNYCQTAYGDEMCRVVDANKLTLREWILHQGSMLFRQLLFQPEWCNLVGNSGTKSNNNTHGHWSVTSGSEQHRKAAVDPNHVPCWYKHKLLFDNIPTDTKQHLVEYVVNNLAQWFAAIGIYEELTPSLKMFEHVYDLPFTECLSFKSGKDISANAAIFDNRSNRKRKRRPMNEDNYGDDNDPQYLKYDYEVQQALEPDLRIYKEALKVFRIQRQVLFNKLSR